MNGRFQKIATDGIANIQLNYNEYREIVPGCKAILINTSSAIIRESWRKCIGDNESIIHLMITDNTETLETYHREALRLFIVSGNWIDAMAGVSLSPGDVYDIAPFQKSVFKLFEGSEAVLSVFPKLPPATPLNGKANGKAYSKANGKAYSKATRKH